MNKRLFSGIQPSGTLHLGNYLGAIKNWVALQEKYEPVFCVVDLHAITVPQKPEELRKKTIEVAKIYLAAGIDPKKSTIFVQSHVPEHTELAWILNTITKVSELERMTQFKDKTGIYIEAYKKNIKNIEAHVIREFAIKNKKCLTQEEILGLFKDFRIGVEKPLLEAYKESGRNENKVLAGILNYPVLMAADILLYETNVVPVGEDQLQHVEIARTLARRFNITFGETFVIPEPYIVKEGMRIMGLDDPAKKMSKSATSEYNYIALTDDPDKIQEKIKKAVTDSGKNVKYSDDKPAIKNLINIYALLDNAKPTEIASAYRGKGYAEFKKDLAEIIIDFLKNFQDKFNEIEDREVLNILENGAARARTLAKKKMEEVKEKVGLLA
jgi:tryptophanyl-tRNA synthetase